MHHFVNLISSLLAAAVTALMVISEPLYIFQGNSCTLKLFDRVATFIAGVAAGRCGARAQNAEMLLLKH